MALAKNVADVAPAPSNNPFKTSAGDPGAGVPPGLENEFVRITLSFTFTI